jgi:CheY-like chemotaxis protein
MAAAPDYFNRPQRTALIVDDSRLACAVLGRLLEQEGFRVDMAASGQEALERLRRESPDVVFMDHLMPGMTGLEAVQSLKSDARTASIPVVMFSSQEDEEFLTAAREAGALAVLTKHTERTNLGPVLSRLGGLQPALEPARAATAAPPQPAAARSAAPPPAPAEGLTRAALRAEIVPLLRTQRDQIRKELLAEFALLENQQEGVRRALMGRMEALIQRALQQIGRDLTERLSPPRPSWGERFARGGLVAAALGLLAVPIGLTLGQQQRLEALSLATQRAQAAATQQSTTLDALRSDVAGLGRTLAETSVSLRTAAVVTAWRADLAKTSHTPAKTAAPPLAEMLAASGIEGPVELRSRDGAYCLELEGDGYRLTPMTAASSGCVTGRRTALLAGVTPAATLAARP